MVDEEYGQGVYTKKQIQNMLYNLKRESILIKTEDNRRYTRNYAGKKKANGSMFSLNDYIKQMQALSIIVSNELNRSGFLERYTGIDLNILQSIYLSNKNLLKEIKEISKKIDEEIGDKIRFYKNENLDSK
ncbi:hypothetical protein KQI72_07110 [Eubacterium sp. MSJ-21]|nr:hypothetical protein [Eubacterium sp. MSJ-21]